MAKPAQTKSKVVERQRQTSTAAKPGISLLEIFGIAVFLVLPVALPAILSGQLRQWLPQQLQAYFPAAQVAKPDNAAEHANASSATTTAAQAVLEACEAHKYTSEIVSLDPLVIYINNFTSPAEAQELINIGEPEFADSFITRARGDNQRATGRTSQSAPLPLAHPLVTCLLARARTFMGSMLQPSEPFSVPQLVRYFPSQKYDFHTDHWAQHQRDDEGRHFNRVASFFVFLRDNCTQGETYFPLVDVLDRDAGRGGELEGRWRGKVVRGEWEGERKGVKFRPVTGNAVFWVNMDGEGEGDRRVVHAGLPVGEGEKIGLNIWPRKYYGVSDEIEKRERHKKKWGGSSKV